MFIAYQVKNHLNARFAQPPSPIDLLWNGTEESTKNMVRINDTTYEFVALTDANLLW